MSTSPLAPRRAAGDAGTFLILWALLVTGLAVMVAIVIDLSALRQDRRASRSAADAAATAGAMSLGSGTPLDACNSAWHYAIVNLDLASAANPCSAAFGTTCTAGSQASAVVGEYRITVKTPVADDDPVFMQADSIGGDRAQAAHAVADGTEPCARVGVRVELTRAPIFGGVAGVGDRTTDVHSVARYREHEGSSERIPALVALQRRNCRSVDAGNGTIRAFGVGSRPGLIYADSDGSGGSCGTVFNAGNPGTIQVDSGVSGSPSGEIATVAPPGRDYSTSGNYIGTKVRLPEPIGREQVDRIYHCGNVTPLPAGCTVGTSGNDHIGRLELLYAGPGAPAGFNVFPNPALGQSCNAIPATFSAGNWYIDCPTFALTSATTFTASDVIVFAGNITMGSGANFTVNPTSARDTTIVVRGTNGISTSSNNWQIHWNRTFLLMHNAACAANLSSCGRLQIQNGTGEWTAPTEIGVKNLMYWSETTQPHVFQGNPSFSWSGILFAGSSLLDIQGNAQVDARNVQLWVDSAKVVNASAYLYLAPDPSRSIGVSRAGSALIR